MTSERLFLIMRYLMICMSALLLVLTACSSTESNDGDAIIKKAETTGFEEELLEIMNDQAFMYDIVVNNNLLTEIFLTIDYYENGEFINEISMTSTDVEEAMQVVFMQREIDETREEWIDAIITDNGHSSGTFDNDITDRADLDSSAWGGIDSPTQLYKDEKRVVAQIVYTNNSVSIKHDIETAEDLKEAVDYEQVYIISIELK